jgi:hypothetical protein
MSHLSRDRLLDAVEGRLDGHISGHLAQCARCRTEVEDLRATLKEVRRIEVPEPSPLFWEYLSARVRDAIAIEPPRHDRGGRSPGWTRWPAASVLALLVLASTVVLLTRTPWRTERASSAGPSSPASVRNASTESFELASGDDWQFIVDAAGAADWDAVQVSGIEARPGTVDVAISELSSDERRELVKLLSEALAAPAAPPHPPKGDV